MKILIWEARFRAKHIIEKNGYLLKYIVGFIEKDIGRCNSAYFGNSVISTDQIATFPHDFILVGTLRHKDEIFEILRRSYSLEKSFYIDDFVNDLSDLAYDSCSCFPGEVERNRILTMALTANQISQKKMNVKNSIFRHGNKAERNICL